MDKIHRRNPAMWFARPREESFTREVRSPGFAMMQDATALRQQRFNLRIELAVANKVEFAAAVRFELKCARIRGAKIKVQETACRFSRCGIRRRGVLRHCKVAGRQNAVLPREPCRRGDMRLAAYVPATIIPRVRFMQPS